MTTAARTIARFVAGIRFESIPGEVVSAAKRHLVDALGTALAGSADATGAPVVEAVRSWAGVRESTVLGFDFEAPAPWAALANGTLAHALDFDDTHPESVVHPSAVVLAAAMAVGEEAGSSGRDLLAAAVAGYETLARVGAAAPGRFHARGLHPTGLVGPFGAAAVAARLWGLDEDQTTNALGIAGSQSSGLFAYLADGSATKPLHAGWAAHAGVVAADLARRGFTGPEHVFEGPNGFFDALLAGERHDAARLVRGLGAEWETRRIAIKPYPACHFVHAYMDAAAGAGVRWGDVEEVVCRVAPAAVGIVCEPRETVLAPQTPYAARFSLPFAVAAAIVGGREGLDAFGEEAIADRRILTLAERVRHVPDDSLPFPRSFPGAVAIHTRGGRTIEAEEMVNRGHPDRPMPDDEVASKFTANAQRRLDAGAASKLLEAVMRLDELDSIQEIGALARMP